MGPCHTLQVSTNQSEKSVTLQEECDSEVKLNEQTNLTYKRYDMHEVKRGTKPTTLAERDCKHYNIQGFQERMCKSVK